MTADAIHLRVLTETGLAVEDQAVSIVAPGEVGYLGMWRNHAPLVTTLAAGRLRWRRDDGARRSVDVGDGVMEIAGNRCTVLTSCVSETTAER